MTEDEIIKNRITNLISVRQLIVSILIVLTGGVTGLFFAPQSIFKTVFIILGAWFIVVLFNEFINTNREIRSYLYKK